MKNLRNQKGITLVALVVTIIVLLILAGVSLSLVAGSDGILSRATNAVDKNLEATVEERVNMKLAEYIEDYYEEKYVNRSIDNSTTALQFISGTTKTEASEGNPAKPYCKTYFTVGNAKYWLVWGEISTTISETTEKVTLTVFYNEGKTKLKCTASVSKDGVMTEWKTADSGSKVELPNVPTE